MLDFKEKRLREMKQSEMSKKTKQTACVRGRRGPEQHAHSWDAACKHAGVGGVDLIYT